MLKPTHDLTSFTTKLLTGFSLVLLADWLCYDHLPGWTLGMFAAVLLFATVLHNPATIRCAAGKWVFGGLLGLCASMTIDPNSLNVGLFAMGIIALALHSRPLRFSGVGRKLEAAFRYLCLGWFRIIRDTRVLLKLRRRMHHVSLSRRFVRSVFLPLSLTLVFIALFAHANPVIGSWLDRIDWAMMWNGFSLPRIGFWLLTGSACWALIRPRMKPLEIEGGISFPAWRGFDVIFNVTSVRHSLLAFNGLFLLQNALDMAFLWSDALLPVGMTHAQYAHQGAYPLIVTALLSAAFVLIALKPGSATASSPLIRGLVYLWIGQNILLVGFSMLRLYHYIDVYSLTYLRVAAFIWMGLVAIGLALIVARLYWHKSAAWLVERNLLALLVVLYVSSFVPFGMVIADFNVRHCQEVTGKGSLLDMDYLVEIGPEALPAFEWFAEHARYAPGRAVSAREAAANLETGLSARTADWHSWTLRNAWLQAALPASEHEEGLAPSQEDGWQVR